ncbi:MAG: phosphohydrolase [Deltaproteobacteria bacterium]|nr:phosphohydrolase [Deltaproteobacteria bacterium]
MAKEILINLGVDISTVIRISDAIRVHRFKGQDIPQKLEEKILFDADKLDILGAVGLARSYMVAGEYNQSIYSNENINDYIQSNLKDGNSKGKIIDIRKHAPNLEYEIKIKKIPDRLFTNAAKKIAKDRIEYMTQFFERLKSEVML